MSAMVTGGATQQACQFFVVTFSVDMLNYNLEGWNDLESGDCNCVVSLKVIYTQRAVSEAMYHFDRLK